MAKAPARLRRTEKATTEILARCLTRAIHKRYIQSSLKAALKGAVLPQHVPEWWNWQTRRTQNPVGLTARVGSSPSSGTILMFSWLNFL
jgi:hypothetical protein